jgi:hypothetical protein
MRICGWIDFSLGAAEELASADSEEIAEENLDNSSVLVCKELISTNGAVRGEMVSWQNPKRQIPAKFVRTKGAPYSKISLPLMVLLTR